MACTRRRPRTVTQRPGPAGEPGRGRRRTRRDAGSQLQQHHDEDQTDPPCISPLATKTTPRTSPGTTDSADGDVRWPAAWRRTRQDQTSQPRRPDEQGAWLIAVRHPDRSLRWIRHDRAQHLAIEVDVDEGELFPGFVEHVHELSDVQQMEGGYPLPMSVAAVGLAGRTKYRPGALWAEEYHHVPLTQVMVDGSDFRQSIDVGIGPRD